MKLTRILIAGILPVAYLLISSCYAQSTKKSTPLKKCLIVSDIHFAPLYGATSDTVQPMLQKASFDQWIKYFKNTPAQMQLNSTLYFKDANYAVLQSSIINMKKRLPHPAFIVIAGDFIWHNATIGDSILKKKCIQFIARLFKQNYPNVPIIPAMGNNDTYGEDYALQDPRFLNDFADAWQPNLPKASADSLKAKGYYTVKVDNMKFVVVNSAPLNYGTNYPQAPVMLNWLSSQLAASKNVWVLNHIPAGINAYNSSNFWNPQYTQSFVNMVATNSSNIKLLIASHTHFDDFKVIYNKAGVPVSLMRIVASVCSNHGNNPSFDVADIDGAGTLVAETRWYLNLAKVPPYTDLNQLVWTDNQKMPSVLGLKGINARSFAAFTTAAKSDTTGKYLNRYVQFYNIGTANLNTINKSNEMNYLNADSLKAQ